MCRTLLLGVLFLITPALLFAQADQAPADKAPADKTEPIEAEPAKEGKTDKVKAEASKLEPPPPAWVRWGREVFTVLPVVLLTLIVVILIGLRSDIAKAIERWEKGGGAS